MSTSSKQYADRSLNSVQLEGNVVQPKYFPAKDAMPDKLVFKLANPDDWTDEDGTIHERTNWIQIELSGGRAKGLQNLILNKAGAVLITGKLTGINAFVKEDGKATGNPVVRVGRDDIVKVTRWKKDADQSGDDTMSDEDFDDFLNGTPGKDIPF